jgi:hypothetical protein
VQAARELSMEASRGLRAGMDAYQSLEATKLLGFFWRGGEEIQRGFLFSDQIGVILGAAHTSCGVSRFPLPVESMVSQCKLLSVPQTTI